MTSLGATFSEIALIVLILIVNLSDVEARRSRSFRYRSYSYYSGNSEVDSTEAIIAVSVILGIVAFIVIFVILRAKCCPYWSPIESIADCITDCKKCESCSKKDPEIQFAATPVETKPKARRKNTWAPVKKHMGTLRLAMHTPKPVLLKRESKNLEKKISLYESNPTHYRDFMEPPPAYEYVVPARTEKSQESSSEFLQNRQRISRISRTISAMRFDEIKKAKAANQLASEQATQPGGSTSQDPRPGKPPHSRVLVRTRSN